MKKALAVLVLALFVGTAAFAVPAFGVSAGAGGMAAFGFKGGGIEAGGDTIDFPSLGGGAFVFLDATFAELDIGFTSNSGTVDYLYRDYSFSALSFGLLGKYPFELGPVIIFPMAGIEYRYVLSAEIGGIDLDDASDMSRFGIRFGAGFDTHITPAVFFRCEFLYAIRFANKYEKDYVDALDAQGIDASSKASRGLDAKVAIGYQFF
jgi:opacity protein-like surface antigen